MRIILIFLPDYRSNFQGLASHSARGVGPGRGKRNNYYYNNKIKTKNKKTTNAFQNVLSNSSILRHLIGIILCQYETEIT